MNTSKTSAYNISYNNTLLNALFTLKPPPRPICHPYQRLKNTTWYERWTTSDMRPHTVPQTVPSISS